MNEWSNRLTFWKWESQCVHLFELCYCDHVRETYSATVQQDCDVGLMILKLSYKAAERTSCLPKVTHPTLPVAEPGLECKCPWLRSWSAFIMWWCLLCPADTSVSQECHPVPFVHQVVPVCFPMTAHLLSGRARSWQNFADSSVSALDSSSALRAPHGYALFGVTRLLGLVEP